MTVLSPENQATLDRIKVVGPGLSNWALKSSDLDMIMTAVRNEALSPRVFKMPMPEKLPRAVRGDPAMLTELDDFITGLADARSIKTDMILAVGYLRGAGLTGTATAVFIALMNLFPETDFS